LYSFFYPLTSLWPFWRIRPGWCTRTAIMIWFWYKSDLIPYLIKFWWFKISLKRSGEDLLLWFKLVVILNFLFAFWIKFDGLINLQTLFFEHVIPSSFNSLEIRGLLYLCLFSEKILLIFFTQFGIFNFSFGKRMFFSPVKAASVNIKHWEHPHYWIIIVKNIYQFIYFSGCELQMANAFFNISRSCFVINNSFFSTLISFEEVSVTLLPEKAYCWFFKYFFPDG
jgi:hypothetical protein